MLLARSLKISITFVHVFWPARTLLKTLFVKPSFFDGNSASKAISWFSAFSTFVLYLRWGCTSAKNKEIVASVTLTKTFRKVIFQNELQRKFQKRSSEH